MEEIKPLENILSGYSFEVDKNNRFILRCLCDGTMIFLYNAVQLLGQLKCTDIKLNAETVSEGIPEGKPWCNCLFTASGVLPENIGYDGERFYYKGTDNLD